MGAKPKRKRNSDVRPDEVGKRPDEVGKCFECGRRKQLKLFVDDDDGKTYCRLCWIDFYGLEPPAKVGREPACVVPQVHPVALPGSTVAQHPGETAKLAGIEVAEPVEAGDVEFRGRGMKRKTEELPIAQDGMQKEISGKEQ